MNRKLLLLAIILLASALACSLPGRAATSTPMPTQPPLSTQDVAEFKQQVATASANLAATGELKMTISETQLTAFILSGLMEQPDIPMTEPLVQFQNNQILLSGKTVLAGLTVPATLVLEPKVENGLLTVTVVSAHFGDLPVPETMLTNITEMINANLSETITIDDKQIQVETVQISDGKMTITGKSR